MMKETNPLKVKKLFENYKGLSNEIIAKKLGKKIVKTIDDWSKGVDCLNKNKQLFNLIKTKDNADKVSILDLCFVNRIKNKTKQIKLINERISGKINQKQLYNKTKRKIYTEKIFLNDVKKLLKKLKI